MKKIGILLLLCCLLVNVLAIGASGKARMGKRSFSRPPQQSTMKPLPAPSKVKEVKKVKTQKQNTKNVAQTPNRKSGFLRNLGLLAGGMMLGSLFASLFGGSAMLGNLLGMLFNAILLVVVLLACFLLIRFLWRKVRGTKARDQWEHRR